LLDLQQDIIRLMALAYEGPRSELTDVLAVDSFIRALNNSVISMKVRELEPGNLDEAVRHARRFESYAMCCKAT